MRADPIPSDRSVESGGVQFCEADDQEVEAALQTCPKADTAEDRDYSLEEGDQSSMRVMA